MKHKATIVRMWTATVALLLTGALFWLSNGPLSHSTPVHAQAQDAQSIDEELAALRADVERLKQLVPDQAHAMQDVGYHFTNLWFAGTNGHWALADFYLGETRSHLKWAVNIIPVRQTAAGEVDLNGIREAFDNTLLASVKDAIDDKDLARFDAAYRESIEGCYACHKSSEKPFVRPHIPGESEQRIINFNPDAEWPQ